MNTLLLGLRAIAEPTRLRILGICAHAELTASDIVQILGQSQPRVSRHLKLLTEAGLLERNQEGNWAYYQIPQRSDCAQLARTIVDLIPENDPTLALDLNRLEDIKQARAQKAEEYFRNNASDWETLRDLHVETEQLDMALKNLLGNQPVSSLLDIGTATGHVLKQLSPLAEEAVGVDISREMLSVARSNLDKADYPNVQVRYADMYKLPFAADSFDLITIHMVLHFAEDPARVLKEAARVLQPGGRLVIVDFEPHSQDALRDQHAHRWLGFAPEKINTLLAEAGLVAEAPVRLEGDPLTVSIWPALRAANDSRQAAS